MTKNQGATDTSHDQAAVAQTISPRGVGAALRALRESTVPSDERDDPLLLKSKNTGLANARLGRTCAPEHGEPVSDLDNSGLPGAYPVQGIGGPGAEHELTESSSAFSEFSASLPGAYQVEGIGGPGMEREHSEVFSEFSENPPSVSIEGAVLVDRNEELDPEQGQGQTSDEVIEGTLLEEKQPQRKRILLLLLLLGVLLVLFVPIVVLGVLPSSSETVNPDMLFSEEPPMEDEPDLYPPFTTDLPNDTLTRIQVFNSSFYKANLWMRNDPNLDTYSLQRRMQRFQMVIFFYQTGGPGWFRNDNWLSYQTGECSWFSKNSSVDIGGWHPGMEPEPMCDENGQLKVLNMTRNNVQANNPVHQTGLGPFKILDLSHNKIKGSMATFGGFATEMQVLDISHNLIAGQMKGGGTMQPIPLRVFRISGTQLVGLSPVVCRFMPHLEVLSAAGNPMGTELTAAYSACHNMTHFVVANTALRGQIPSEFGTLQRLKELNISSNPKVMGTIPTEISLLPNLSVLDVSQTAITGVIPEPLCARAKEGELEIRANCSMVQCCS